MAVDPRIIQPSILFTPIELDQTLLTYKGFGKEILVNVPQTIQLFRDNSTDDIWGFFDEAFGIQIDSDLEIIIIWTNEKDFKEFGHWLDNPILEAIKEIKKHING